MGKILWGRGILNDLRARAPYYWSDIVDSYNYRVIPSVIFIFFTNLLPAIAFAQDMFDRTDNSYGVNEVLMSSAIAGVVFGLFSGQPLCIVGVTGPIAIFSYTVYEIIEPRGTSFFPFMCWIYLWAMFMHFVIAVLNWVLFIKIISNFSCEVFGLFICIVYCHKAGEILVRQFETDDVASGFASVMIALLMVIFGLGSTIFGTQLHYFKPWVRKIFVDYGVSMSVIFFTGCIHFGGYFDQVHFARLATSKAFEPTINSAKVGRTHGWFIHFWPNENISVKDVFLAIPFALLLTFLLYFDHNVSSLMCQLKEFPLKKPPGFHWDFALLGLLTGISGLLGIPAPNGLIPQAHLHTASLVVHDHQSKKPISVVEQRLTNTLQGGFTFVVMTKPLLIVLELVPQAVLCGLFFIMGISGLHEGAVVNKVRFLFLERDYIKCDVDALPIWKKLSRIPRERLIYFYIYLALQVVAGVAEFAITLTRAAIGFPGVLLFFALCAKWIWPLFIPSEDLEYLDGAVAQPFIIKSLEVHDHSKDKASEDPNAVIKC